MRPLSLEQLKGLNIEISSACTARCPFCSRQQKIRPYGQHLMSLDEFKLLPDSFIRQLKWINFGGDFGDLSTNAALPAIIEHIRELNPDVFIGGDTNAASQDENWWFYLGQGFGKGAMTFCIDGLSDTHALHRVGTNFHKVLRNVKAFTEGGGTAYWKYIVFKHNEHQIETAAGLAEEAGCRRFFAISSRDYDAYLEKPEGFTFSVKRDLFNASVTEKTRAICKPLENGSIYIAADGSVHPCCFAHVMYICEHNDRFRFILPLIKEHIDEINFKTRPLETIIAGPYFEAVLKSSRENAYCRMKCGGKRDKIRSELILYEKNFYSPVVF